MIRKLLYSFLLFIFLQIASYGQAVNTYCFTSSSETYNNLTGTTNFPGINSTDDDSISNSVSLGFSFIFGGVSYNQIMISTNGWINFGSTTGGVSAQINYENSLTNAGTIKPALMPLWDDLKNTTTPTYVVSGTAPNRIFKIEWKDQKWDYAATNNVISFQVWLYETSNIIQYKYKNGAVNVNNGSATIGIYDTNNTYQTLNALGVSQTNTFNANISVRPVNNTVYTFAPPVSTSNAGVDLYGNAAFTLAANTPTVGAGTWTIASGPNTSLSQFNNVSSPTATFTPLAAGTYTLNWTISNGFCTSTDQVIVSNCSSNLIINGDFSNGQANWVKATTKGNYVEVLTEGVYFGNGNTDNTAELDLEASLRQDVTVIPGVSYTLSFVYARRPGSPASVAVDVKLTGGSSATVNYTTSNTTNTPFLGSLTFTPTSASLGIEFYNSQGTTTLGSIVDNIVLIPTSQINPIATTSPKGNYKTLNACSNVPIQLDVDNVSTSGVTYAWTSTSPGTVFSSTTIKNPTVTYTGTGLKDATVVVTTAGGCSATPSTTYVNLIAPPTIYSVTGGGSYCSGGSGLPVGLSNSTIGINYQLQLNGVNNGATVAGTGSAISFGTKTVAGTYTVIATNANCSISMSGNAVIAITPNNTITRTSAVNSDSQTRCINTAITNITYSTVGATGATFSGLPSGVTGNWTSNVVTISGTPNSIGGSPFNYIVTLTGGCGTVTATGSITVNPVHTITAASNQNACQNSAITAITMTLGGGATGATVTGLPSGVNYAVSGNTLTISGTPTVLGTFNYSVTTTGNSCAVATTGGTITVGIGNNIISFANGTSGSVCANTGEDGTATFTAPAGTYFNSVSFASYGSPTGTCAGFQIDYACHSPSSQSFTEGQLLGNTGTISFLASNGNFGDPCVNTLKRYYATAAYSQPICSGTIPGQITGATPTGSGNYIYSWQMSTTSATTGFGPAPGTNNTQNYTPTVAVTANTWFRRVVTSNGVCPNTSAAVLIKVNPRPTAVVSGTTTICSGTSTQVSVTFTGTAPWSFSYTYGAITGTFSTSTNPYTVSVNPTSTTTYSITALSDANSCAALASGITGNAVITVNPLPSTPTLTKNSDINCGTSGQVTLTNLPSGAYKIHQTGQAIQDITDNTASRTITGLAAGNYSFTVENSNGCISGSVPVTIIDNTSTTTWNGSGWSNGLPNANKTVIISSAATQPFTGTPINIAACTLIITSATDVIIPSGFTFTVTNSVTSNGKLIFKNNSSLIQTTNAINTGEIVYERETNISRFDLTYWSMPVTKAGFTMSSLSPNTLYDKYFHWDAIGTRWLVDPSGVSLPMELGKGYSIRGPQSFDITIPSLFTGIFTGVPNNGNIAVPVEADKWNLIGNPYPSAVDAEELILVTNKDVLGALYFWTHASPPVTLPGTNTYRYVSSDYIVFSGLGSTRLGTGSASTGTDAFNGKIAAGQAFFAKPTASVINFNNGLRRGASDNTQFYKTAKTSGIEKNRIWLNLSNAEGAFKQTLLGYAQGATNNIDLSFDAVTMSANTYIDFYSISESKKLAIQARALPFNNTDLVALGYKSTIAGEFTIAIDHTDGFFDAQEVYLEDKFTGIITDLRKENYTFTTAVGTSTTRFVLRYTNKTLDIDNPEALENSILVSFKDQTVKITSSKEIIKEVNIYNVGGQLLYAKNNVNASELQITDLHSGDQVILVKVTLENGYSFTKKVIFSNLK